MQTSSTLDIPYAEGIIAGSGDGDRAVGEDFDTPDSRCMPGERMDTLANAGVSGGVSGGVSRGGRRTQFRHPILLLAYHILPRLPNSFSTPAILLRSRINYLLPSHSHLPLDFYRFDSRARPAYKLGLGLGFHGVDG